MVFSVHFEGPRYIIHELSDTQRHLCGTVQNKELRTDVQEFTFIK